jgi:hypothetical protein
LRNARTLGGCQRIDFGKKVGAGNPSIRSRLLQSRECRFEILIGALSLILERI